MICGLNVLVPEIKDLCRDMSIDPQIERLETWKKENKIHPDRYSKYYLNEKKFLIGLGILIVGVCLTIYSYLSAQPGGTYPIYWGLVLAGIFGFINSVKKKIWLTIETIYTQYHLYFTAKFIYNEFSYLQGRGDCIATNPYPITPLQ